MYCLGTCSFLVCKCQQVSVRVPTYWSWCWRSNSLFSSTLSCAFPRPCTSKSMASLCHWSWGTQIRMLFVERLLCCPECISVFLPLILCMKLCVLVPWFHFLCRKLVFLIILGSTMPLVSFVVPCACCFIIKFILDLWVLLLEGLVPNLLLVILSLPQECLSLEKVSWALPITSVPPVPTTNLVSQTFVSWCSGCHKQLWSTTHHPLLYSGKFWIGANFCVFRMMLCLSKRKTAIFGIRNFNCVKFWTGTLPHEDVDRAMALYWYFLPSGTLPIPNRPLSMHVSPAAIKDTNEAIRN